MWQITIYIYHKENHYRPDFVRKNSGAKWLASLCMCMINLLATFTGPLTLLIHYLIVNIYLKRIKNNGHSENMTSEFHFIVNIALLIQFARSFTQIPLYIMIFSISIVVFQSLSHVWPFCNPMDCSPLGSSVHTIFKARTPSALPFPSLKCH